MRSSTLNNLTDAVNHSLVVVVSKAPAVSGTVGRRKERAEEKDHHDHHNSDAGEVRHV